MKHPGTYPVRKPLRLGGFDYSSCGIYFVTVCVQHMESRFGAIEDGQVALNDAGLMVASIWESNATRYSGIALDAFVVMPNHLHTILFLRTEPGAIDAGVSLSKIVQTFKSLTTVTYTRGVQAGMYPVFDRVLWQRGFHDRILHNHDALEAARLYIEGNPARAIQPITS
jgi:REP element-mobilizing transposase RayT